MNKTSRWRDVRWSEERDVSLPEFQFDVVCHLHSWSGWRNASWVALWFEFLLWCSCCTISDDDVDDCHADMILLVYSVLISFFLLFLKMRWSSVRFSPPFPPFICFNPFLRYFLGSYFRTNGVLEDEMKRSQKKERNIRMTVFHLVSSYLLHLTFLFLSSLDLKIRKLVKKGGKREKRIMTWMSNIYHLIFVHDDEASYSLFVFQKKKRSWQSSVSFVLLPLFFRFLFWKKRRSNARGGNLSDLGVCWSETIKNRSREKSRGNTKVQRQQMRKRSEERERERERYHMVVVISFSFHIKVDQKSFVSER